MNARIQIVHSGTRETVVAPWGFDLTVTYEYEDGEPAIHWPTDRAHPGFPPNVTLAYCRAGGVDITEMLTESQRERIEEVILEQLED